MQIKMHFHPQHNSQFRPGLAANFLQARAAFAEDDGTLGVAAKPISFTMVD